jgi:mRNA interferase MazF
MLEREVRRGDIWWVDFNPVRGSEQGGTRPALVLQNDIGNRASPVTIVAAITSWHRRAYPFHVALSPEESGLERASLVLLNQIRTVDKSRLISRTGQVPGERMLDVEHAIKLSLGIES